MTFPWLHKLSEAAKAVWGLDAGECHYTGKKPKPFPDPAGDAEAPRTYLSTMVSIRSCGRMGAIRRIPGTGWGRPDLGSLPRFVRPSCCCCCCRHCFTSLRPRQNPASWTTRMSAASATSRLRSPSGPAPSSV